MYTTRTVIKKKIAGMVSFVFCAVDMPKDEIKKLEEAYAKLECPVISNNSANRGTPDVPMIVPEINPEHAKVIDVQRKRLGTKTRLYSSKVKLLASKLCSRNASSYAKIRNRLRTRMYIPGYKRCRKTFERWWRWLIM